MEGCSNPFFGRGGEGGEKALPCFKVHRKLFRRIAVLESTLTQFALPAMLTNGLHCARLATLPGTKRAEIERITTVRGRGEGRGSACTRERARRERGAA